MHKLEEMDEFPETCNLSRWIHEEIENLNRYNLKGNWISNKMSPNNKSPGPDIFIREFYKTITDKLMSIILKFFQIIEEERTLPNLF